MTDPLSDAVEVLLGMAYEHRLRILVVLMDGDATPTMLAASLALDATLIAHHLRHLLVAHLVRRRRAGRQVFYGIDGERNRRLISEVLRYTGSGKDREESPGFGLKRAGEGRPAEG